MILLKLHSTYKILNKPYIQNQLFSLNKLLLIPKTSFPSVNWYKDSQSSREIEIYSSVDSEFLSRLTEVLSQLSDYFSMQKICFPSIVPIKQIYR